MKCCIWSSSSFEKQSASNHLIESIILSLLEKGHEVFLIQRQWGTGDVPLSMRQSSRFSVQNIPMKNSKTATIGRYLRLCKYYLRSVRFIKRVKNAEVVFVGSSAVSWLPIFLLRRKRIRVVYNIQDLFPKNAFEIGMIKEKSVLGRVLQSLQTKGYRKADEIIAISEDIKKTLIEEYGVAEERIVVIYNWGHETSVTDNIFLKKYPRRRETFRVVYAGNIGKMQNVDIVLKAQEILSERQDIEFYIMGSGSEKRNIEEIIRKEAHDTSGIHLHDALPSEHSVSVYQGADLIVVPLAPRIVFTALPSKTADCLMSNQPIVFCIDRESEFAKKLGNYQIPVVSPGDAAELAAKIQSIKENGWKGNSKGLFELLFKKEDNLEKYIEAIVSGEKVFLHN